MGRVSMSAELWRYELVELTCTSGMLFIVPVDKKDRYNWLNIRDNISDWWLGQMQQREYWRWNVDLLWGLSRCGWRKLSSSSPSPLPSAPLSSSAPACWSSSSRSPRERSCPRSRGSAGVKSNQQSENAGLGWLAGWRYGTFNNNKQCDKIGNNLAPYYPAFLPDEIFSFWKKNCWGKSPIFFQLNQVLKSTKMKLVKKILEKL